jgi:cell cycle related kinase
LPFPPQSSPLSSPSSSTTTKPVRLSHKVVSRFYRCPELLYGAREYDYGVDVWAYGCIVAELFLQCPLFQSESDIQQLIKVIATLGSPTDQTWPEMHSLPDYGKIIFPQLPGIKLETLIPSASPEAIRFLKRIFVYSSLKRASAEELLDDEWFYTRPLPVLEQIFPLSVLN